MKSNSLKETCFERAIFLSWYCSRGDCSFCYMSTQKDRILDPSSAKRSFASVFAEAIISKECGWELEFISGGYDSFSMSDLVFIVSNISKIFKKKVWLNLGALKKEELQLLAPYVEGVIGTVECINPEVHGEVCPSKPISEVIQTFEYCDELGLKKGITLIVGLGESIDDFPLLKKFVEQNNISRITFYALNPQKGTPFDKSPDLEYYVKWITLTRRSFPNLHITAGAWHDKTNYFSELLSAGADNITKFPALKLFNSSAAKEVENQAFLAGRKFRGTLTKLPSVDWDSIVDLLSFDDKLKDDIKKKLQSYLKKMN